MSRPNISLHKKVTDMENSLNSYVKRTQKDYSESFKISVVREIESGNISVSSAMQKYGIQGGSTLSNWRRKFGNFAVSNQNTSKFMQTPHQRIMALEQKVRLLEKEKNFLEQELIKSEDKVLILDKIIELAETELHLPIKKNLSPNRSK